MDNSILPLIDSATSILVLLPQRPTFDQVASGLSFYLTLMDKKQVSISCPSPMMVGFNRIIGINKITSEVGNKNLSLKFKGYEAANIEKVSYDIVNGEFNLTVVPKVGFTAPSEDQIDVSFNGLSADLIILIGGVTEADFPILNTEELINSKIVHVGVQSFSADREVLSFAKPGAAVSELIANLVKQITPTPDVDVASNLLMGIEDASGNFTSNEVTPETFEMFAYLLRSGGKRSPRTKLSPVAFPPGAIPTQPYSNQLSPTFANASVGKQVLQATPQAVSETDAQDVNGTGETEQEINPPDDWLQPKVFKSSSNSQPGSFSENKG